MSKPETPATVTNDSEQAQRPVAARMLDSLLEGSSFGHGRRLVPLKPGEVARASLFELPEGMREETDAELRARLRAEHERARYATLQDLALVVEPGFLASVSTEQIDAAIKEALDATPYTLPPGDFDRLVVERAVELLRGRLVRP